jgi:hypothetical protein
LWKGERERGANKMRDLRNKLGNYRRVLKTWIGHTEKWRSNNEKQDEGGWSAQSFQLMTIV